MILALLGEAGAGKTTIAKQLESIIKDCFVIDGDELRNETNNYDIKVSGREANMELGFSRARRLSDLGFTVIMAMQAPIKEIREKYLKPEDRQVLLINHGENPKNDMGFNKNFSPDYSEVGLSLHLCFKDGKHNANIQDIYNQFFPKVLVPSRFQGFHKGHKVVMEEAKRLSPNITIGLRVDDGDQIDLEANISLLKSKGYKTIKTPSINEEWTNFANQYDIYVQGNPMVIEKFKKSDCRLHYVPRYGDVSGTSIRNAISKQKDVSNNIDDDVKRLLEESI